MEILKNKSVIALVKRAVRAGTSTPSFKQLETLAVAVGDAAALTFLRNATVRDHAAVRTCIAVVNGEAPKKVSDQVGTLFGLTGEKETTIASEKQERIYSVKPGEPTTEEEKDIAARKKVEVKHPETSDHKTEKAAVAEPLKPKNDFPEILARGKKNPVEKRGVKKTAAPAKEYSLTFYLGTGNMSEEDVTEKMRGFLSKLATAADEYVTDAFQGGAQISLVDSKTASKKTADAFPQLTDKPEEPEEGDKPFPSGVEKQDKEKAKPKVDPKVVDAYVARIKKGEDPRKVLTEFGEELTSPKKKDEKKPEKPGEESAPEKGEKMLPATEEGIPEVQESLVISSSGVAATATASSASSGENVKLWKLLSSRAHYSELMEGQQVIVNDPSAGQVTVTVEGMGTNPEGQKSLVGKTDAGELIVLPEGTQVMQEVQPNV